MPTRRRKHRKKAHPNPEQEKIEKSPKGDVPEAAPPGQAGDPFAGLQPLDESSPDYHPNENLRPS